MLATSVGRVAIHAVGRGPGILLLHANPGSSRDFAGVTDELAKHHRVIAVDWPGYGSSPLPDLETFRGALSYRDCLVEILDQLAERGWGPFVLLGSSVGGFASLSVASLRPEIVAGLVLVAPGGFTPRTPFANVACRALGRPSIARFAASPLAHLYLRRRNSVTRQALAEAKAVGRDPELRRVFAAVWASFLDPAHDLREECPPKIPILLTWGEWDPVLMKAVDGRRAASALGVDLTTFRSGHEPYAETPDQWLEVVVPFLASIADSDRWSASPAQSERS